MRSTFVVNDHWIKIKMLAQAFVSGLMDDPSDGREQLLSVE